jgi:NADPH-dependent curcumin reductase CurA
MAQNTAFHLVERPTDEIVLGKTFEARTSPLPSAADLKDGEIIVEVLYLSLDPAMRGWLNDSRSYVPPVPLGSVMRGAGICRVLHSRSKLAKEGDLVTGLCGWTEHAVLKEGMFEPASNYPPVRRTTDMLSALGLTGTTAWVGMTHISGGIKPGETVVVSGAAGATGSIAAQIAKIAGARVIAIAGSDDKCKYLSEELGLDVVLNYKDADFKKKFYAATENFIDVYFDNVGGDILDMCLGQAKQNARFVCCGMISQYNTSNPIGPKNISRVVTMRIRMQGFIVMDHADKYADARRDLAKWIEEGKLKTTETIITGGLRAAETGLIDLYKGVNTGKLIVEIKNPDENPSKL